MKKIGFHSSPTARKRRKSRVSPLPANLAVYLDGFLSPHMSSFETPKSPFVARFNDERKGPVRAAKTPHASKGMSMDSRRPVSDFSYTHDTLDPTVVNYKEKFELTKCQLEMLNHKHSKLIEENQHLRSLHTAKQVKTQGHETWDWKGITNEVEELYDMLSQAHGTIGLLIEKKKLFVADTTRATREVGMFKYSLELTENTKEVKVALLEETVKKRTTELVGADQEVQQLRADNVALESQLAALQEENQLLLQTVSILSVQASPDLQTLSQLHEKLSITTSLLEQSEERVSACEEFIRSQIP